MSNRYPRSILVTLCFTVALAVAATFVVNARHSGADGYHDKAGSTPAAPQTRPLRFDIL